MECREVRELLPAYVDAELRASLPPGRPKEGDVPVGGTARSAREHTSEALAAESHLETCADCRAQHAACASLRSAIATHATYFTAPATLAHRIQAALPDTTPVTLPTAPTWRWLNIGGRSGVSLRCAPDQCFRVTGGRPGQGRAGGKAIAPRLQRLELDA